VVFGAIECPPRKRQKNVKILGEGVALKRYKIRPIVANINRVLERRVRFLLFSSSELFLLNVLHSEGKVINIP